MPIGPIMPDPKSQKAAGSERRAAAGTEATAAHRGSYNLTLRTALLLMFSLMLKLMFSLTFEHGYAQTETRVLKQGRDGWRTLRIRDGQESPRAAGHPLLIRFRVTTPE